MSVGGAGSVEACRFGNSMIHFKLLNPELPSGFSFRIQYDLDGVKQRSTEESKSLYL